ncbi:hypothetical protein QJ857_gp0847 [Tupanvirus soda lake]|uniref:Ricin B lectin domain-containing protein n=2 Tax=Tupanvirus TaxID=2094720 RepID=A0A6N1NUY5_9VIRU|nr:hypothetical protein QJ857_gp0847 [Tupanvirus soda lake]QKU35203.1 hypothetical protein [Tupanvirus soda lake]
MGNANGIPVNITSNHLCMTVPTVSNEPLNNGIQLVASPCANKSEQEFSYNPTSKELRYGTKCVDVNQSNTTNGTKVQLWSCNGSNAQKWNFGNNVITSELDNNKCLNIKESSSFSGLEPSLGPSGGQDNREINIYDCNMSPNQKFTRHIMQTASSQNPTIINNNIAIPFGSLPVVQLSILPPHTVLLVNTQGKNILINSPTIINNNSKELQCLKSIEKFIIGPLTNVELSYNDYKGDRRTMYFKNGTLEHDFVYDLKISFSKEFKDLINEIIAYNITNIQGISIQKTVQVTKHHVQSGTILISKYPSNAAMLESISIDLRNFQTPTTTINIYSESTMDYILGPYSAARLGNQYLYNSSNMPLLYHGLKGVAIRNGVTNITMASPLNSGYAIFYANCDFNGSMTTALIGEYAIDNNIATHWSLGRVSPGFDTENPITNIGPNKISAVIVGPYTKVTLYKDSNYGGTNKVFENNGPHEVRYNLCVENFNNVTASIKIEYAGSYVGYGLISGTPQFYKPNTYEQTCDITPQNSPNGPVMIPSYTQPSYPNPIPSPNHAPNHGSSLPFANNFEKETVRSQSAEIDDLAKFGIDCGNNGLAGFQLVSDSGSYYIKYVCDPTISYHTNQINSNYVNNNSLNNLINININCNSKAITGVKTSIVGNSLTYEYSCGDKELSNITSKSTMASVGYQHDLQALINQNVKCDNGQQLISFNLTSNYNRQGPNGNLYKYAYTYSCGTPSKSNTGDLGKNGPMGTTNTAPIVENYNSINESKYKIVDISYSNNDIEYHIACPCGVFRKTKLPTNTIQINGDGIAIDFVQESGNIDTFVLKDKPITIDNNQYIGFGIKSFQQTEEFKSVIDNCFDWQHIIIIILVVILIFIVISNTKR